MLSSVVHFLSERFIEKNTLVCVFVWGFIEFILWRFLIALYFLTNGCMFHDVFFTRA